MKHKEGYQQHHLQGAFFDTYRRLRCTAGGQLSVPAPVFVNVLPSS